MCVRGRVRFDLLDAVTGSSVSCVVGLANCRQGPVCDSIRKKFCMSHALAWYVLDVVPGTSRCRCGRSVTRAP